MAALLSACSDDEDSAAAPTADPQSYVVSGAVTGLNGTLVLQNNGADDLTLNADGTLRFTSALPSGAAYLVTVRSQPAQQTCTVTHASGTIGTADVSDVSVSCTTDRGTGSYTIGGSVSGLVGSGLVLQDNAADDLPVSGNGRFTFATSVANGGRYTVTIKAQPAGPAQICTLTGNNGVVAGANVADVAIACATITTETSGMLDPTFGSGGKVLSPTDYAQSVRIQPDGKIVTLAPLAKPNSTSNSFTLTRFNGDGSLDISFGINGSAASNLSGTPGELPNSLALQGDGKIVVGGAALVNGGGFALARFNANGSLDVSFGTSGKAFVSLSGGQMRALAIQADGKLVATGFAISSANFLNVALARFLPNGTLDASFGNAGIVVSDLGQGGNNYAESIAIQADGKLVVAGQSAIGGCTVPLLGRYDSDGQLDTSFGAAGRVSNTSLLDCSGGPAAVALQADGKIVVSKVVDAGGGDFALSRYNADGSPDTGFGTNGVVTTDLSNGQRDTPNTVVVQADGKLLVAGSASKVMLALVRYQSNGALDTAFGAGGKSVTDLGGMRYAVCNGLAIQADGKIIGAGGVRDSNQIDSAVLLRFMP